jgi:hypothetical protein
MKNIITVLLFTLLLLISGYSQNKYSVQPGVRNNQIVLQISNTSTSENANNLEVKLIKDSKNIKFNQTEKLIEKIGQGGETEVNFTFDVPFNVGNAKVDTIEFVITDNKDIYLNKQFILEYAQPTEYKLEQNYPNPFNPTTKIRYSIPNVETHNDASLRNVTLKIYDILGDEVATLVNEKKEAGYYEIEFNASSIASGVYIYRLQSGSFTSSKKMMVLK